MRRFRGTPAAVNGIADERDDKENAVALPAALRAQTPSDAPNGVSRAIALAVWDAVISEDASFFDTYPREGKAGPFGDDEKIGIIREILAAPPKLIEPELVVRPPGSMPRHELIRQMAAQVMGVAPGGVRAGPSPKRPIISTTSLEVMMSLGTLASTLPDDLDAALDEARARWSDGLIPVSADDHVTRSMLDRCRTWARCGFPRIVLASHRLAASMMWIDASKQIEDLAAPWQAFWISIPNNLVHFVAGGRESDVTDGFVHVSPSGAVVAEFGDAQELSFQMLRPNLSTLGRPDEVRDDWVENHLDAAILLKLEEFGAGDPPSESMTAAFEMLANLVHSVCVDMTAHRPSPRARRGRRSSGPSTGDAATTVDYVIEQRAVYVDDPGADDVNCIGVVRDYLRDPTRSRTPKTQRIHRAHYQMQPHGPWNSLRRLQLHRAYRQGPTDAPVAVRPHVRRRRS